MKKCVNGQIIEMTEEEIKAANAEGKRHELMEKSRPMTAEEVNALLIREQINTLAVDDNTALRMLSFYPTWEDCVKKGTIAYDKAGYKFQYGGKLYACLNPNPTFQSDWIPGQGTESLYAVINETHAGTLEDPIPYDGNMALTAGLYYVQDYIIYLCTRDTVNPVYNALSDMVGLYVERV